MRKIELYYKNANKRKIVTLYVADDALDFALPHSAPEEAKKALLIKIAMHFYTHDPLSAHSQDSTVIFLNKVFPGDNDSQLCAHYTAGNGTLMTDGRKSKYILIRPENSIHRTQNINLADDFNRLSSYQIKVDHLVGDNEQINNVFSEEHFDTAILNAAEKQAQLNLLRHADAPPIDGHDVPLLKDTAEWEEIEKILGSITKDRTINEETRRHLTEGADEEKRLESIIHHHQAALQEKLDLLARGGDDNDSYLRLNISSYEDKQLKKLQDIIDGQSKQLAKFKKRQEESNQKAISDMTPREYIELKHTYHYIKKNIIISLYNAARDYYQIIWAQCKSNPEITAERIASFNEKFSDIAQISNSLQLSPIEDAYAYFLPLKIHAAGDELSFSGEINTIIDRCGTSNGKAFQCVADRLNTFNTTEFYSPIDKVTRPGAFFNPIKNHTYVLAAAVKIVKENIVAQESTWFVFTPYLDALRLAILKEKSEFEHKKLIVMDRHTLESVGELDKKLRDNTQQFVYAYKQTSDNIDAFRNILTKNRELQSAISEIRIREGHKNSILDPLFQAKNRLRHLQVSNGLPKENILSAIENLIDQELASQLDKIHADRKKVIEEINKISDELSAIVKEAEKNYTIPAETNQIIAAHIKQIANAQSVIDAYNKKLLEHSAFIEQYDANNKKVLKIIDHFSLFEHEIDHIHDISRFTNKRLALQENGPNARLSHIAQEASNFYQRGYDQHNLIAASPEYAALTQPDIAQDIEGTLHTAISTTIPQHIGAALEAKKGELDTSKKDTNDLLLCHTIVSAILNFEYWQSNRKFYDTKAGIEEGFPAPIQYLIPKPIFDLAALTRKSEFHGWTNDPVKANELLVAIKAQTLTSKPYNPKIKSFYAAVNSIDAQQFHADRFNETVGTINTNNAGLFTNETTVIQPSRLRHIQPNPTFWERHPILKKAGRYALIGLAVVAAVAIAGAIIYATGGIALIGVAVAAVGGIAGASGIAAAIPVVTTITGAIVGAYQEAHKPEVIFENHRDERDVPLSTKNAVIAKVDAPSINRQDSGHDFRNGYRPPSREGSQARLFEQAAVAVSQTTTPSVAARGCSYGSDQNSDSF